MIGEKIKELRINNKMTQKELAEKLYVTAQAVSRWENGEVEPSLSTLVEISKIFNVSTDELLNLDIKKEPDIPEVIVKKEYVFNEVPKQHLTLCESCNKPIYEQNDLVRINEKFGSKVICKTCHEALLAQEEELKREKIKNNSKNGLKRRIHSFVWGGLATILPIIATINTIGKGDVDAVVTGIVLTYAIFAFISTMILNNTFLNDWFIAICSWGIVTFPGLIWEFSLDGFLWLIGMKILFWLLGLLFGLICCIFAIIICGLLSIIVYPFALVKNIKNPAM